MPTYKTPGVYVEEISTLPPSVAEVSTAIPAFIGYTEKGPAIARINTLLEYETLFGVANPSRFSVQIETDVETSLKTVSSVTKLSPSPASKFLMYYSLSHYFKNGGGSCYILSTGDYSASASKADFEGALVLLEKEDEPTLIVLTDAVALASDDYYSLCVDALAQCEKLGDRFTVLDIPEGDISVFRNKVGTANLKYGAAYHPYLETSLNVQYQEAGIQIAGLSSESPTSTWSSDFGTNAITVQFMGSTDVSPKVKVVVGDSGTAVSFAVASDVLTLRDVSGETGQSVKTAWDLWVADSSNDAAGFDLIVSGDSSGDVPTTSNASVDLNLISSGASSNTLQSIESTETALYNQIKTALTAQRVTLPPSAAIVGVYARVDRERGVWKAPANVSLASVIGPVSKITHQEQEDLNVDPTAGKSINAIRQFAGKGTLVWGARTLAGNDNEWRYVPVRRLFNMIEESTQKATAFAVFEPNDATTWLKVKAMIDSYLYGLWEQGALAGPKPESAYFVNVGLGKTMTTQDVLEGRMIVEIGVAAVRPAEFIILRFSHKLQEA
ncbi:MAG: phage tail sheath C-terminal domain-containing protein [Nitrospirota bacterium]|nr:phage tail sheath C-terminal domain-containing protein [Nitrospirota bacterium]